MAHSSAVFDVPTRMKTGILAIISSALFLVGCSYERTPYSAAEKTNNPPRAEAAYTNTPVAPTPTSDRTNARVYSTNSVTP